MSVAFSDTSLGPRHSQQHVVDTPVPDGSVLVQDVRARPPTSTSRFRSLLLSLSLSRCLSLCLSLSLSVCLDLFLALALLFSRFNLEHAHRFCGPAEAYIESGGCTFGACRTPVYPIMPILRSLLPEPYDGTPCLSATAALVTKVYWCMPWEATIAMTKLLPRIVRLRPKTRLLTFGVMMPRRQQ